MKALLGSVLVATLVLVQPAEKPAGKNEFSYESLPQDSCILKTIPVEDTKLKVMPVPVVKKKKRREIHVVF
jgi:hypothetical protein